MATLYYKILQHHQKKDGTFNIKICLTHKGKQVYHSTTHHASPKQLKRDLTIKDNDLLRDVMADVSAMSRKLSSLGESASGMAAKDLLKALTTVESIQSPNFVAFCLSHIETLKDGYKRSLRPTAYSIRDFFGPSFPADAVTSDTLRKFEAYVSGPRTIVRDNGDGGTVRLQVDAPTINGVYWIMNGFRVLFNACRSRYNTEYVKPVPNQPFEYYKMPRRVKIKKKGGDLTAADIIAIRDADLSGLPAMARDLFMLSFYLCGINAQDLFDRQWVIEGGRFTYNRSKTRDRRMDEAEISISIPAPAIPLLERYGEGYLQRRYTMYDSMMSAIKGGLDEVADSLSIPSIKFSHARHVFSTLAHNECGFSKEMIAAALNHVDGKYSVTEHYIARNWSVVDEVQAGVLSLLTTKDPI